jgi:hypothetical protein
MMIARHRSKPNQVNRWTQESSGVLINENKIIISKAVNMVNKQLGDTCTLSGYVLSPLSPIKYETIRFKC